MEKQNNIIIQEITPLSEQDCFYIADRKKAAFTYPIHKHEEFELNFTENASGVRRIVGDHSEIIGDYDLVLICSSNLEHVWEQHDCKSEEIREITIQFSKNFLEQTILLKNQFLPIKKMLEKAQNGLAFPLKTIMKVHHLLDKLSKQSKDFYAVLDFYSLLYELSISDGAHVLSSSSFAKAEVHSDSRRVYKVEMYINKHFKEEIRLAELAKLSDMSIGSFSKFFKKRTGKTLSEYLINIRLGYAARQLVESTMSVAEICYDSGFNNLSNFNRIFKKRKGISPKQFRMTFYKKKRII